MAIREILVLGFLLAACGASTSAPLVSPGNTQAAQSCEAGHGEQCSMLGMSYWLQAQAQGGDESRALRPFLSACEYGDWFGCAMAASVQARVGQDAQEAAKKTYPLAQSACSEKDDASACAFLGDWAAQAKAGSLAMEHYSRACVLAMRAETREETLSEYLCKQAIAFGAARESLVPRKASGEKHRAAKRTSGVSQIHPSDRDAILMHRRGIKKTGSEVLLCLSAQGLPRTIYFAQFSEFPRWNHKIFETIREWRYSPRLDAEGNPTPTCTGVTFYYVPTS